ncbi:hypothetical protein V8J82_01185 [Gymnodinialimonas sp. 2305UL16-5]|uniref:hypothetical protein n=1 Tax=Gymnodinialimonas mytili TaxID=3126503 RepID=UPI0030B5BC92
MKKILAAAAILTATAGVAAACPDYSYPGAQQGHTTGEALYLPDSYNTYAGGPSNLRNCTGQAGFFTVQPNFQFQIDGLSPQYRRLQIRAVSSCDTVLLVNDAHGNWYHNDDTNGFDPAVTLVNAPSGTYDIWVGTYNGQNCSAQLQMETWNN